MLKYFKICVICNILNFYNNYHINIGMKVTEKWLMQKYISYRQNPSCVTQPPKILKTRKWASKKRKKVGLKGVN